MPELDWKNETIELDDGSKVDAVLCRAIYPSKKPGGQPRVGEWYISEILPPEEDPAGDDKSEGG